MTSKISKFSKYLQNNKKKLLINTGLVLVVAALASGPAWYYLHLKQQVYEPTKACDILTVAKASDILGGDRVINVESNQPVLTNDNTLADSRCSFTDSNADTTKMKLVAVAVQSAIDDEGVATNQANFEQMNQEDSMVEVTGLGQKAFYNPSNGQLNILQAKRWVMIIYGVAEAPQATEIEELKKVASDLL